MELNIKQLISFQKQENILKHIPIDWNIHANFVVSIAKNIEPKFQLTEATKKALSYMLRYFTGIKSDEYDLNKGLFLVGGVGSGKSLLFKIFEQYTRHVLKRNSFNNFSSAEIIDNVNMFGVDELRKFSDNFLNSGVANPITCYIDDIGSRNEKIKHFGSEINVIEQLLSTRYNVYSRYRKITHISTNKNLTALKETYDTRVIDRIKEMFNIVVLEQKSFR